MERATDILCHKRISMEITMTDEMVIRWVHEVLGVGTVVKKPRKVCVKTELNT